MVKPTAPLVLAGLAGLAAAALPAPAASTHASAAIAAHLAADPAERPTTNQPAADPSESDQDQAQHRRVAQALRRILLLDLRALERPAQADYAAAARVFELLEQLQPNDPEAIRDTINAAADAGERDTRLAATRRLVRADPTDSVALLTLVDEAISRRQTAEARLAAYDRLLDNDASPLPRTVKSRLAFDAAQLHNERGETERYIQRLTQAIELDSTNKDAAVDALYQAAESGTATAPERFELTRQALLADPLDPKLYAILADELLTATDYRRALRFLRVAVAGYERARRPNGVVGYWNTTLATALSDNPSDATQRLFTDLHQAYLAERLNAVYREDMLRTSLQTLLPEQEARNARLPIELSRLLAVTAAEIFSTTRTTEQQHRDAFNLAASTIAADTQTSAQIIDFNQREQPLADRLAYFSLRLLAEALMADWDRYDQLVRDAALARISPEDLANANPVLAVAQHLRAADAAREQTEIDDALARAQTEAEAIENVAAQAAAQALVARAKGNWQRAASLMSGYAALLLFENLRGDVQISQRLDLNAATDNADAAARLQRYLSTVLSLGVYAASGVIDTDLLGDLNEDHESMRQNVPPNVQAVFTTLRALQQQDAEALDQALEDLAQFFPAEAADIAARRALATDATPAEQAELNRAVLRATPALPLDSGAVLQAAHTAAAILRLRRAQQPINAGTQDSPALARLADDIPAYLDRMVYDPGSYAALSVERAGQHHDRVRIRIRNLSGIPLGYGPGKPISSDALLLMSADTTDTALPALPEPQVLNLFRRLRLEPGETVFFEAHAPGPFNEILLDAASEQQRAHTLAVIQNPQALGTPPGSSQQQTEAGAGIFFTPGPWGQRASTRRLSENANALARLTPAALADRVSPGIDGVEPERLAAALRNFAFGNHEAAEAATKQYQHQLPTLAQAVANAFPGWSTADQARFAARAPNANQLQSFEPADDAIAAVALQTLQSSATTQEQQPDLNPTQRALVIAALLTRTTGSQQGNQLIVAAAQTEDPAIRALAERLGARAAAGQPGYARATNLRELRGTSIMNTPTPQPNQQQPAATDPNR